jgi:large subunit ribosomal protein L4e
MTQILSISGKASKKITIPEIFRVTIRPDIIKRAVISEQSHRIQPQGRDPMAGKRTTAESRGTGLGIARLPRVKGSSYRKAGQAALAPGTVGGRQAHPPKTEKNIKKQINKKERQLAIASAIAATADKKTVASRGHVIDRVSELPIIVSDKIQSLTKTMRVKDTLEKIGVWQDVERVKDSRKVRAGRGKARGRKIKQRKGPLIVVAKDEGIRKAARNISGVDIVTIEQLNIELLAPGTHPGRLTIWSESAIKKIEKLLT